MAGRGIVIKIEGDGESAKRALEMVREQLAQTAEQSEESGSAISESMEMVKRSLELAGVYLGIREVIDGVKELVGGSLELGESMTKLHERTGLSVETLSVLHYAAGVTGSDFEGLVNGIGRMEKTIGQAADGNKQASQFIKGLGLDAKDLAGRADGAEIAFHKFVETLAATENPIRRNQLAMQLMGKAGSAQIPVLIEVAEHWDELKKKASDAGVLLTGETAKALADTNQRMKDMEQHIQGVGLAFTEGMAPGLSQVLGIMSDGKGQLDSFNSAGQGIAKTFAFVGSVIYSAASAAEALFSLSEGGRFTEIGRRDAEAGLALHQKAQELHDLAFGDAKPQINPLLSGEGERGSAGFEGGGGGGAAGKAKSDDSITRAASELLQEQAKAMAAAQKAIDEQNLAELENQHRLGIVSDQDYYAEKLRLQTDELDAEVVALTKKGAELQALYDKQHADKLLKRDTDKNSANFGKSAEELKTAREMLQVQDSILEVEVRRGRISAANTAEVGLAARATELESLKIAAELEKERNNGITAQLALLEKENEIKSQAIRNKGGSEEDVANLRATTTLLEYKLRIDEVEQSITAATEKSALAAQKVKDAAEKDPRLKSSAEQSLNRIYQQEADALKELAVQYDALAQELGGPFLEKAAKLHAEIDRLNTPSKKTDAEFTKKLADGITSMAQKITEQTIKGKTSFHDMVKGIEQDVIDLALKLAEQKIFSIAAAGGAANASGTGFWAQIFGASAEHHMSGGQIDGPAVVGEAGPEIWTPPQQGGSIIPAALSQKLADTGGGGKGISVTSNVINQTKAPVQSQPSEVSYDSQMRTFVIHTVLEDAQSGGPTSQLFGG